MAFFSWCVALGKILTANNLRMRGIVIMVWCFMCKKYGENANHFFLYITFCIFGVYWVMLNLVLDMLVCWKEREGVGGWIEE